MSKCEKCITNRSECVKCKDNPIYIIPTESLYKEYIPTCPRGYTDCVGDPAYILFNYPYWYKELYGNKTPLEAAKEEGGCYDRFLEDPDEDFYCYDDEDK